MWCPRPGYWYTHTHTSVWCKGSDVNSHCHITLPHFVPFQFLYIHQDPHQLRNGQSWVGVIQLNGHLREQESTTKNKKAAQPPFTSKTFTRLCLGFFSKPSFDSCRLTFSGNISKDVLTGSLLPIFEDLNLRTTSCSVAATRKYSCFRRSSFPSKNCRRREGLSDSEDSQRQTERQSLSTAASHCRWDTGLW